MQYFNSILLKSREQSLDEFWVTPEIVKTIPHHMTDLYGKMPKLVDSEGWVLDEITRRVAELYESHENGNFEIEDLLAGNFPPLLLSCFAMSDN